MDLTVIFPRLAAVDPFELGIRLIFIAWGFTLLYLGLRKVEPLLMIPLGIGMILANAPGLHLAQYSCAVYTLEEYSKLKLGGFAGLVNVIQAGDVVKVCSPQSISLLAWIYHLVVRTEIGPVLTFAGIGAMADFRYLIAFPIGAFIGAATKLGISVATLAALATGLFNLPEAMAIGVIGGADGPTTIYVATNIAPHLIGPLAIAIYSYVALVPIIQPPIVRVLVPKKFRGMKMPRLREVSSKEIIVFWLITIAMAAFLAPAGLPLIIAVAMGNIVKESGISEVVARYGKTIADPLLDTATILTMLGVGSTLSYDFLSQYVMDGSHEAYLAFLGKAFLILGLGLVAFTAATVGGILIAWVLYVITKGKVNPVIGCAGVSAMPISARVAQKEAQSVNPTTYVLLHALGPNVAGSLGTSIMAGYYISYIKNFYLLP